MKFLYKIYSGYDGFSPARIKSRAVDDGKRLVMGWARYLDAVSLHDECWVYFHGPHQFENGVYVKGTISSIDRGGRRVELSLKEFSTEKPLTDRVTSARVEDVVSIKGRQVFAWPDQWVDKPDCMRESCGQRLCSDCDNWRAFARIDPDAVTLPPGLMVPATHFVPAYWAIPARCYLWREGKSFRPSISRLTYLFNEFKIGEARYAYPLALGIYQALRQRRAPRFDALVPIPLSPNKRKSGELHRTLALCRELSRLLGVPVLQYLSLSDSISKRSMMSAGSSKAAFEARYYEYLEVNPRLVGLNSVLLIDDVCTHGSTLKQATKKLLETKNDLKIWVATAAQMIVKAAVAEEAGIT